MGLKITLAKSAAGASERQKRTLAGLGLKKMGQQKLLKDTPENRGMVFHVKHLVRSETVAEEPAKKPRRKPRKDRVRRAARSREQAAQG